MATNGQGFASADNLAFDDTGTVFMVSDISSGSLNHKVLRANSPPGTDEFQGIFGHNTLFAASTKSGKNEGVFFPFATGPEGVEMTGPFVVPSDEFDLLLSVQHPGEVNGVRKGEPETRTMQISDRDGQIYNQTRIVPIGSNWPHDETNQPRSSVIQIRKVKKFRHSKLLELARLGEVRE